MGFVKAHPEVERAGEKARKSAREAKATVERTLDSVRAMKAVVVVKVPS